MESLQSKLRKVVERQLPATMASQGPLLELPSTPELSPLVMLKSGIQGPSPFIASGLGGGPAEFFQLVKHIRALDGIYGLQPKGTEGVR
jgi:hypothetical protein